MPITNTATRFSPSTARPSNSLVRAKLSSCWQRGQGRSTRRFRYHSKTSAFRGVPAAHTRLLLTICRPLLKPFHQGICAPKLKPSSKEAYDVEDIPLSACTAGLCLPQGPVRQGYLAPYQRRRSAGRPRRDANMRPTPPAAPSRLADAWARQWRRLRAGTDAKPSRAGEVRMMQRCKTRGTFVWCSCTREQVNSSQRNSELPASGVALSCTIDAAPRAQRRLAGKQRRRASGDGTSDWLERLLPAAYRTLGSASLHLATMHASSAPLRRVVARGLIMPRRRSVSLLRPCQPVHVTPAPHLLQRRRDRARHNGCLRVAGLSPIDVCNTHAAPDPHSPGGPPIARQLTGLLHSRRREATLDRPEGSREHARALPPLPLFSPSLDALRSLP
ncbi:hypothetical protein PsYK624_134390 [Phanerochaete sordida]|uniref:Uncharacterized protein n=1 Tax=Phanerochaete sordida TaxID=48140 RepID=A0A9P3LJ63_9APHY|nr:hypothetical protein PsYK624_134390 [Phanerochaete sordida]